MKNALKSIGCKNHCSSARVVDGKLILSCPEAITPVVWQMDLTQAKASALEVREDEKRNAFILFLKTAKGEAVEVAPFATKAEAVSTLMAAAKAMENAHGKIRPLNMISVNDVGEPTQNVKHKRSSRLGAWLLGFLLIVVLLGVWSSLGPRPAQISETQSSNTQPSFGGQDEPGVPLSADEYLLKKK